ncbi:MAG TPA: hypothetical protein VHR66_02070 [Gemmataceae bacterium]|jgi:hypothetical protein|nr:hypothetical protein [Gemmataceae bacterium]
MQRFSALILCLGIASWSTAAPAGPKDREVLLDVQPMAAPVPALRYQLMPEVAEMNPGNAVQAYLRAFGGQHDFFFSKEQGEERERLLKCPLTDIKPGQLKDYGGSALRQADHAARMEYADWNMLPQMREHGYMLLLPEIQQLRTLASALAVRGRGQLVDKDFEGATRTLKTLFALARHLGEYPTLITGLVGSAIAQIGLNLVEEFIQQPGAPNLYWALTAIPQPLVDVRKAVSAERIIGDATYGPLMDPKHVWSVDEIATAKQKFKEFAAMLVNEADERIDAEQWLKGRVADEKWLQASRKGLVDAGYPATPVSQYPPEQVLLYHLSHKARAQLDEVAKWVPVPYWQAEAALEEAAKKPVEMEEKLTKAMVFNLGKLRATHVRLEQRIDLLRIAEAIRLEAAKNGGKLPASLSDVSAPIPVDPVTGKAFEYKLDGMTALVSGRATPISSGVMQYRYEIRLHK